MKIACIQMTSGPDIGANLDYVEKAVREAVSQGAVFIATPENTDFMCADRSEKMQKAYAAAEHPALQRFADLAKELDVTILVGSVAVKDGGDKLKNRSLLFAPHGLVASYDKIHLFDVDLPSGESRRESDMMEAGDRAVVVETALGTVGLSICYDVRFPHLYRTLSKAGADILTIPAAFTVSTGQMHWQVLLRARAIENGAFVIAPAQCGVHDGGRQTYGHSLIIDPWGHILAEAGDQPTIIYADIKKEEIAAFRRAIPSLLHDRSFN